MITEVILYNCYYAGMWVWFILDADTLELEIGKFMDFRQAVDYCKQQGYLLLDYCIFEQDCIVTN